jgi:hypothetical protein
MPLTFHEIILTFASFIFLPSEFPISVFFSSVFSNVSTSDFLSADLSSACSSQSPFSSSKDLFSFIFSFVVVSEPISSFLVFFELAVVAFAFYH